MAKKDQRFVVIHTDSSFATSTKVLQDTQTGVCYLWHADGYGGGLTPLLNRDGTPVVLPAGSSPEL